MWKSGGHPWWTTTPYPWCALSQSLRHKRGHWLLAGVPILPVQLLRPEPVGLTSPAGVGLGQGWTSCPDRLSLIRREQQEREKALRLQKERLQKELEEKKKKVMGAGHGGSRLVCTELWAEEVPGAPGTGALSAVLRGLGIVGEAGTHVVSNSWRAFGSQEEQQRLAEQRLQEEQQKKAKEAAAASKGLNTTMDVQVRPRHWSRAGPQLIPVVGNTDYICLRP